MRALILASANALGIAATAIELERGRLMRAPDHWPGWRYGPKGQSAIFESEADVPKGWEDHPSKVGGPVGGGVGTAVVSPNTTTSAESAAKSTDAISQTHTDPAISAKSGEPGLVQPTTGQEPKSPAVDKTELDADGHPYDPTLHAATKSKTKDGKWRMKVGVKRPDPAPGYPLDL
jgi:hypothetical protein